MVALTGVITVEGDFALTDVPEVLGLGGVSGAEIDGTVGAELGLDKFAAPGVFSVGTA